MSQSQSWHVVLLQDTCNEFWPFLSKPHATCWPLLTEPNFCSPPRQALLWPQQRKEGQEGKALVAGEQNCLVQRQTGWGGPRCPATQSPEKALRNCELGRFLLQRESFGSSLWLVRPPFVLQHSGLPYVNTTVHSKWVDSRGRCNWSWICLMESSLEQIRELPRASVFSSVIIEPTTKNKS